MSSTTSIVALSCKLAIYAMASLLLALFLFIHVRTTVRNTTPELPK